MLIGQDVFGPDVHVQERNGHRPVEYVRVPVKQVPHLSRLGWRVSATPLDVVEQAVPHDPEGRKPISLRLHRTVVADIAEALAGDHVDLTQAATDLLEDIPEGIRAEAL